VLTTGLRRHTIARRRSAAKDTPGSHGVILLRRSYSTYVEWYACLERAKGCRKELEDTGIDKWMEILTNRDDSRGAGCSVGHPWIISTDEVVGHKVTILAWILMRAGAAVPTGFKALAVSALDQEVTNCHWTQVSTTVQCVCVCVCVCVYVYLIN
jgi:hypothetical protein